MEVLMTFLAAWLFTWPALIGFVVLGVFFEANNAHKMAVFFALVTALVSYFYFHLAPLTMLYWGLGYLGIGFVWSFYRYKRHCDKAVDAHKGESLSERTRVVAQLHPTAMLGTITMWVTIWPFSAVENIAGDLINALQTVITRFFRGIYHRIFDGASAELLRDAK